VFNTIFLGANDFIDKTNATGFPKHHHQHINVLTAGAQAFLMEYILRITSRNKEEHNKFLVTLLTALAMVALSLQWRV
jgi:hypothetical protein